VNQLAKELEDDVRYPFESLGKKEAIDPICVEHGTYKGNLHYVAEFVPALALRGVEFKAQPNELQQIVEGGGGSDAETADSASISDIFETRRIPQGITASRPLGDEENVEEGSIRHPKGARSTDTAVTVDTSATGGTRDSSPSTSTKMVKEEPGVSMTKEELLMQRMHYLVHMCV
jgi:hypothetical protein